MKNPFVAHWGFLGLILLLAAVPVKAQNMVNELDEKFHLEKSITEKLEQTLKTRLEKNYFEITVEATLHHKSTTVGKKHLEDMKTSDNLQNWYNNEINQATKQNARPFELESVVITLGLSDQVDLKYRENLKIWLQSWVQASFGSRGEAQVIIRPSDVLTKTNKTLSVEDSKFNGVGKFQNLLGMLFLGCAFLLGRLLQGRTRKKSVSYTTPGVEATGIDSDELMQKESIRSLKSKIAWISPGIKRQIEVLIASWSDKESQSYLKIAAYLEALAEGGASMPEGSKTHLPILPAHVHLSIPKALANLQELETFVQLSLYQEIYSEMLAGELVEREPRHHDFEFLQTWSETNLREAFAFLPEPCQVTLLTRLPPSLRRLYSQIADPAKLRSILNYSLTHREASDQELLRELHTWQKGQEQNTSAPDFAFKIAKLREVWSVFSRADEAFWLHQVALTHPEMKDSLACVSTNLAFFGDWSSESIRKFCLLSKSRELAAAGRFLPFLVTPILNACGETTRKEIQLEMENLTEPKLSQNFDKFVAAFDHYVETEQPHQQIFSQQSAKGAA